MRLVLKSSDKQDFETKRTILYVLMIVYLNVVKYTSKIHTFECNVLYVLFFYYSYIIGNFLVHTTKN